MFTGSETEWPMSLWPTQRESAIKAYYILGSQFPINSGNIN